VTIHHDDLDLPIHDSPDSGVRGEGKVPSPRGAAKASLLVVVAFAAAHLHLTLHVLVGVLLEGRLAAGGAGRFRCSATKSA